MEPKLIQGLAGTGKTVTIAAKIEFLFMTDKLSSSRKCMYLCHSPALIKEMENSLKRSSVDMTYIRLVNTQTEKGFKSLIENPNKVIRLAVNESYAFFFP
eukprot:GFUD01092693.1.p1 GENE.GFUD01092693.1~~GFUD01092693.1.p1  ORF type:complete len:100 (-),score=5.55 GFUD01092693.1:27-326(-)